MLKASNGQIITTAGLLILRQKPATANGTVFLSLEDEVGIINIICWRNIYLKFRNPIIYGKLLLVTGKLQKNSSSVHLIARNIRDISEALKLLPNININHFQ